MAQSAKKTKSKTKTKARPSLKKKAKKLPARKAKKTVSKKKAAPKKAKKVTKKKAPQKVAVQKPRLQAMIPAPTAPAAEPRVSAGDRAPVFNLPNQSGELVSLSQFAGKKVVLYFYPKDDTPGCTKEACSFRDNIGAVTGTDAVLLGVSFDGKEAHQKFIEKYQLNFPLLTDADKEVAKAYGVYVQKNMYGNISWGIERSTFVIDREGKIAAAFRRVQVDGHTEEVLKALAAIS